MASSLGEGIDTIGEKGLHVRVENVRTTHGIFRENVLRHDVSLFAAEADTNVLLKNVLVRIRESI